MEFVFWSYTKRLSQGKKIKGIVGDVVPAEKNWCRNGLGPFPSARIQIFLNQQIFLCGFKTFHVHTYFLSVFESNLTVYRYPDVS